MLDQSPTLTRDLPSEDAFRLLAGRCLAEVETEAQAFVASEHPEALHRTRVALRRLRAIISLFKDLVGGDDADQVRRRLGEHARLLGEARNWDVYLAETLAPVREDYDDLPGLADLEGAVRSRRHKAYRATLDLLHGSAFDDSLAECHAWLVGGAWVSDAARVEQRAEPVEDLAVRVLRRWRRRIRRNGRHLSGMDGETRHRLRIATKKLRYAAELFHDLFPSREARSRCRAMVAALRGMQDHLGRLNDGMVAYREAEGLMSNGGEGCRCAFAVGFVAGCKSTADGRHLKKALKAYDRFAATKPFWKA